MPTDLAHHPLPPADPTDPTPTSDPAAPAARAIRADGWTGERQRAFLAVIAQGETVERACRHVGMTVSSAYALRRRAGGASFALGWQAASLLARDTIADALVSRAIDGQVETLTRADGSIVSRHRYDNRLAATMLARLDRFADAQVGEGTHHAARLVASEWDAYLDLVEADAGPARTGLFLGTRAAGEVTAPDLAPILALARADRFLRTRVGSEFEVTIDDLDPSRRGEWTAEQWARAEAAGLLVLAPAPDPKADVEDALRDPELPPLYVTPEKRPEPVWWNEFRHCWRTRFPPPADFLGDQEGDFGDYCYERELTPEEEAAVEHPHRLEVAMRDVVESRERDAWFAELLAETLADAGFVEADDDGGDDDDDDGDTGGDANTDANTDADDQHRSPPLAAYVTRRPDPADDPRVSRL